MSLRILVVKLSSLGDVVHTMPAVQDLRAAHPDACIDWVVESAFVPLVERCDGVGRVIACDLRRWRKSLWSGNTRREWSVFKTALRQVPYDYVIDLQGLTKSALVAWLARTTPSGRRIAMANQTEGSGFEAPTRWVADTTIRLEPHVHAVQRSRLLCAAALGYALKGPAEFGLRPAAGALSRAVAMSVQPSLGGNPFVPRKPVVALIHGTSRADKEWPVSSWVALGQRLNHSGFCVALAHGTMAEQATSRTIAAALDDAWVWPLMALDALIDTMAACAGVVGVDSGLSHIAVAMGLPLVQIYNFDTAWRTGPAVGVMGNRATVDKQVSVFATPQPELNAVWHAWEALETPVFSR
ncbi:MAG: lipopolysaccharide heptosyltransferase I [Candidatus Saccharibacteria bacterium]|nr:lipopolysaccharide heptosyltransferase I [Rhodoferax sp.]